MNFSRALMAIAAATAMQVPASGSVQAGGKTRCESRAETNGACRKNGDTSIGKKGLKSKKYDSR